MDTSFTPTSATSGVASIRHIEGTSGEHDTRAAIAVLPMRDAVARMVLLARLVAALDEGDPAVLALLVDSPELVDRLRGMTMAEALRFTAEHCGLSLGVDAAAMRRQLHNVERRRADRETYEYLICAGASSLLLCQLFSVSTSEVRRLRKVIAPSLAAGGRPRVPDEYTCDRIVGHWQQLCKRESSERQRWVLLHKALDGVHLVATLETVLEGHRNEVAAPGARARVPAPAAQASPHAQQR